MWPCSTSSAPASAIAARKREPPIIRFAQPVAERTGGWWMRTTRNIPSWRSASSVSVRRSACELSKWPVAMNGPVARALEVPTIATLPRRRT